MPVLHPGSSTARTSSVAHLARESLAHRIAALLTAGAAMLALALALVIVLIMRPGKQVSST